MLIKIKSKFLNQYFFSYLIFVPLFSLHLTIFKCHFLSIMVSKYDC